VTAGTLELVHGGVISSDAYAIGNGGNVSVSIARRLTINGAGTSFFTGISADADRGSSGNGGDVTVGAGALTIRSNGEISAGTFGHGDGGQIEVDVAGGLTINGAETGIAASANPGSTGNAGSVKVSAGQIAVSAGAEIASSTGGPGAGGDVAVTASSEIVLSGPGPQITAQSTGSGDAGSITVATNLLLMSDGAAISTQASSASGGNIGLSVGDLLYLTNSEVTTSVQGLTSASNGGNIMINASLAVLDHSSIVARAIGGNGGNILIDAGTYVASTDSTVSASSQKGISGVVEIAGITPLNGALVVLSSELHNPVALTRSSCAAPANQPQSSLVAAGRGGLPQDPDASLPALYLAGRDVVIGPWLVAPRAEVGSDPGAPLRCGF
jgi:large exoprotein involved in heme utilization and adhesion